MKEKFLKVFLILPLLFFAQVAPPDEPTVPINNYVVSIMLFIIVLTFKTLKSKRTVSKN